MPRSTPALTPALALALALALAPPAAAEPPAPAEHSAEWEAHVLTRIGRVKAPFATADAPRVESEFTTARLFLAAGHCQLGGGWRIGARVPTAPSSVRQPAGSYAAENAFGNPELYARIDRAPDLGAGTDARIFGRVGAGLPLAGLGSSSGVFDTEGLAITSAVDGWRNIELYEPGVVPLTIAGGASFFTDPVWMEARAKLALLPRFSEAPYGPDADARALGAVWTAEVEAGYWPTRWFGASLAAFAVVRGPAPVAAGRDDDRAGAVQGGIAPALHWLVAEHLRIVVDLALPVDGPLDETLGIGLLLGWLGS